MTTLDIISLCLCKGYNLVIVPESELQHDSIFIMEFLDKDHPCRILPQIVGFIYHEYGIKFTDRTRTRHFKVFVKIIETNKVEEISKRKIMRLIIKIKRESMLFGK